MCWQEETRDPVRTSRSLSTLKFLCSFLSDTLLLLTAHDVILGDGLVLLSAVLYAVSNVCQEHTVKNQSRVEFLGMMGLFGTLISGVQLCVTIS